MSLLTIQFFIAFISAINSIKNLETFVRLVSRFTKDSYRSTYHDTILRSRRRNNRRNNTQV